MRAAGLAACAFALTGLPAAAARSPAPHEVVRAMQHPETNLAFPQAKAGKVVRRGVLRRPWVASGNYASVFKLEAPAGLKAVRVFTRNAPQRDQRLSAIGRHLSEQHIAELEYREKGLLVDGQWYPAQLGDFIEGPRLDDHVAALLRSKQPAEIDQLAEAWLAKVDRLHKAEVGHGDLQHGNALVAPSGAIELVDFDGAWVPALDGLGRAEDGNRNYQHPAGTAFGPQMANFASFVVYASLRAVAADPKLWRFNTGENLIFSEADLRAPDHSAVFVAARASPSAQVRALVDALARLAGTAEDVTPPLAELIDGRGDLRARSLNDALASMSSVAPHSPAAPAAANHPPSARPTGPSVAALGSGGYAAEISQAHPAAILFLVDQSPSTRSAGIAGTIATRVNEQIAQLVYRASKGDAIRDYFRVGVTGYGSSRDENAQYTRAREEPKLDRIHRLMPISRLAAHAQVAGDEETPVWVEPPTWGDGTPMAEAFDAAHEELAPWVSRHPNSFPPIVINISDGEADADPSHAADRLRSLATKDGRTLLFNIHVRGQEQDEDEEESPDDAAVLFPSSRDQLRDPNARAMFDLSSELPAPLIRTARAAGFEVREGARAMAYNVRIDALAPLLDIGTRPVRGGNQ